ncbi:hypothetical protein AA0119_g7788 [Alternaria tenuissima]|uniref:Uncharacterized protein n=1 Tax=Alternaria tenuissima TaxID=119927 RepID=A0A4Q4PCZ4_9PLEO|nr:hypothetical protein AA0114_g4654 [Alternaria tenuissima]RYN97078.1 hypothetical protein AA0119_g7788 [Alternaria tenuissima]
MVLAAAWQSDLTELQADSQTELEEDEIFANKNDALK